MALGLKNWSFRAFSASACALVFASFAMAAEPASSTKPQEDAATSLKKILERAGEKGLLKLEDDDGSKQSAQELISNAAGSGKPQKRPGRQQFDCHASEVLDLWSYAEIDNFKAASKAKSAITSYESVQDVIPVAQTFLALGLGTEAAASLRSFNSSEAKLLSSLGRIIDGIASGSDVERVASYEACGSLGEFWVRVAQSVPNFDISSDTEWALSSDQNQMLLELPKHLSRALTAMIGIHAAELGRQQQAESFYTILEPQYRYQAEPTNKSDETLYFYALLQAMKEDPVSHQIFEHLAQRDGVFQVRALLKLVQSGPSHSTGKKNDHLTNLLSVQQQYRGKVSSRKVSLEIVKKQTSEHHYAYAIDLTKKEFSETDSEYKDAVEDVGAKLTSELNLDDRSRQINALNGYLHDTGFFSIYSDLGLLQYLAHKAAVDLNLPEIAQNISQAAAAISENAAALAKDIVLAEIKLLFKEGDYANVLKSGLEHAADQRFQALLKKASLKQGVKEVSAKIERSLGSPAEKLQYTAEAARKRGDWAVAKTALRSLKEIDSEAKDSSQALAIVEYVAKDANADRRGLSLATVHGAESLNEKLDADIGLVKEFLTNG